MEDIMTQVTALELGNWIDNQSKLIDAPFISRQSEATSSTGAESFKIEVVIPVQAPTIRAVAQLLSAVDRALHFATLIAFMEEKQLDEAGTLEDLFQQDLPSFQVVSLGLSSVKVTIEGDAKEVAKLLGQNKPSSRWKSKLAIALALILGVSTIAASTGTGEPRQIPIPDVSEQIRNTVDQVCQFSPHSKFNVDFGIVKAEIPCPDKETPQNEKTQKKKTK